MAALLNVANDAVVVTSVSAATVRRHLVAAGVTVATRRRVFAALLMHVSAAAAFSASAACWSRRVVVTLGGLFLPARRCAHTTRRACVLVRNGRCYTLKAPDCVRVAAPSFERSL